MASSGDAVAPAKAVDKLKYLEKYMSGKDKKKKKRTKPTTVQRLRILDDDVDLKQIPLANSREATPEEDEPTVGIVIDERPLHARVAEQYTPGQWRKLGKDADRDETSASPKQRKDDSDESPPRKRRQACYRGRHDSDSDLSPERPAAVAEPSSKHGELARNSRGRGTPPSEPEPKNSRHKRSPQKASQHSSSKTSPQRRNLPSTGRGGKERSPKKRHSTPTLHRADADISSTSLKHRKEQISMHCGSSPERFYSDEVKVKVEPPESPDNRGRRSKSSENRRRGRASPSDSEDPPLRTRSDHSEANRGAGKHKRWKEVPERRRSPQYTEVVVKKEPVSPHDDHDEQRLPRLRHDSDSDLSPSRPSHAAESVDSDLSPKRPRRTGGSPALRNRHSSDSDLSPPRPGAVIKRPKRRGGSDSDLSPVRLGRTSESPVPIKSRGSDSDLSPPRPGRSQELPVASRKEHHKQSRTSHDKKSGHKSSPPKSKHRATTRATDGKELGSPKRKGREPEKVQEVVKLRDTSKADRAKEKAAKEAEMAKIYSKWGKGLAQQEQQDQKLAEHLHEMAKPFSRYEDDEDLERHLKDQEREGDPMLNYMRKKKQKKNPDGTANSVPKYSGPEPPPNRFGIRPGYRWDGVDRSNGFEKKLVDLKNNRKATEEIAYKWSVEDL